MLWLAAAAVSVSAQTNSWELSQPGAKLLMGIDGKSLRESAVGQSIREEMKKIPSPASGVPSPLQAPMQAMAEISFGILLVLGLLTRPVAFVAFLYLTSLWMSEWGTAWIWELLVPVLASLALAVGRAGRGWGVDALLARRWPSSPWW